MNDYIKDLGELLESHNMQVTFTGWRAELEKAEKELESLKKQNEIMRKALEFYAKEVQKDHWPDGAFKEEFYAESPLGRRARQALAEIGEVKE